MFFETLTLVPFDLDGVDISLLNEEERKLLDDYHAMVKEKIAPYLPAAERAWLKEATRPVSQR